jgi:hypothetical protein
LPAPLNFPFGEDHVSSAIFVVLTLCTSESCSNEKEISHGRVSWQTR